MATILSCAPAGPPPSPGEVQAVRRASIPATPGDAAWGKAPVHVEPLILQDLVEPRLLVPSTAQVKVQAITDGTRIAFRLEWDDSEKDDLPGAARFSDACAVQLPARTEADVPAPQMGEAGRTVEITYWRASWQAEVEGRADDIKALYPGATVDHYPFEAAPLEKQGEAREEMKARYAPAPAGHSEGKGLYAQKTWTVVLSRPLPAGLGPGGRSQVAFAVWEGARQEAGSRKMRTGWTPLSVEAAQ